LTGAEYQNFRAAIIAGCHACPHGDLL